MKLLAVLLRVVDVMLGGDHRSGGHPAPTEKPGRIMPPNKVAIAVAAREAMKEHRSGKPIAFQDQTRPSVKE